MGPGRDALVTAGRDGFVSFVHSHSSAASAASAITFSVNVIQGTAAANVIDGSYTNPTTSDRDLIEGFAGNDVIDAGDGNDLVFGGAGEDSLIGGAGADQLFGEDGNDYLEGGAGDDQIDGGAGVDIVQFAGSWADFAFTATADSNGDLASLDVVGTTSLTVGLGTDTLVNVEALVFDDLAISLANFSEFPTAGDDLVIAQEVGGSLSGGAGNDILIGQAGNDTFDGGAGNDTLIGGLGNDAYILSTGDDVILADNRNDELVINFDEYVLTGLTRSGTDMVFTYDDSEGDTHTTTLVDNFGVRTIGTITSIETGQGNESLTFQTNLSLGAGTADLILGTSESDSIVGGPAKTCCSVTMAPMNCSAVTGMILCLAALVTTP